MTPDAKLRMDVYQEGQRAFGSGAQCPYAWMDWRAKTWQKGHTAARRYHERVVVDDVETDPKDIGIPGGVLELVNWLETKYANDGEIEHQQAATALLEAYRSLVIGGPTA